MREIQHDSADVSTVIRIVDSTDGTPEEGVNAATGGLALWYRRTLGTKQAISPTDLSALDDAHSDGGLLHIDDGYYRLDLPDAAVAAGASEVVTGGAATGMVVIASYHYLIANDRDADLTTLKSRLGAFTGSGVNTVLGFLKALFRKDLTAPTDVGGNVDPRTDSNEALRDRIDRLAGAGFSDQDSLKSLRSTVETSGTTASTSTATAVSDMDTRSGGFLDRLFQLIREHTGEPGANAKYPDTRLLHFLQVAWSSVWIDIKTSAERTPTIRYDITIVADKQDYPLPANLGEITRFYKVDTVTGLASDEWLPQSELNPGGPGFTVEGPVLRVTPVWTVGETIRIAYVPNGDIRPHESIGYFDVPSDTTDLRDVVFHLQGVRGVPGKSPIQGALDRRQNAYASYLLRVFTASDQVVEGLIGSSDWAADTVTVRVLHSVPSGDGLFYEIVPVMGPLLEGVLAMNVARRILAIEGKTKALKELTKLYVEDCRAVRINWAHMITRRASHLEGDTVDNREFDYLGLTDYQ